MTVTRLFPKALLQWEDFAPGNGRHILERYRDKVCTFNDDMQGTGAITLAAAISAIRVCGTPLRNQRVAGFGGDEKGAADQIRDAMTRRRDRGCGGCVDRKGLLTTAMNGDSSFLKDYQAAYARPHAENSGWKRGAQDSGIGLAEVVRRVQPNYMIGGIDRARRSQRGDREGNGQEQTDGRSSSCFPHPHHAPKPFQRT